MPVGGGKQRRLLALLLLRLNEVVPRDALIAELFGGAASEAAANALQAGVSRLRRSLGAEVISTRPAGYVLMAEPDQIDLFRFEQLAETGREELAAGRPERAAATLRAALALWRGSPLQDVGGDAVEAEAHRLEELRLAATIDRIDADLALGRGADLVAELQALTADQPYQERLQGQLMLALYRAGRQTEALEVYRATRRLLVQELGIEPARALQRLERAILVHDPSLAPSKPPAPPAEARETGRRGPRIAPAVAALLAVAAIVSFLLAHGRGTAAIRLGPDRLGVIDPRSGRLVDSLAVGTAVTSIDAGAGVVWAASETADVAVRIAAKTGAVKTIGLPVAPAALAVGRDAVWVVGEGKLLGIDVRRNQPLEPVAIYPPPRQTVAVGFGAVWVAHDAHLSVHRFDPAARQLQRIFPIYPGGILWGRSAIATGVGAVWTSNLTALLGSRPGFLVRIDPRSRKVTGSLRLSAAPSALATGFGSVWATLPDSDVVARIDPNKMSISRTIAVGRHPIALAVGEGAVWVASDGDDTISRIDPTTERVTKTTHLARSPAALAAGAGSVWVATT